MLFNSALFILYFLPVFLLVYMVVPTRWKNAVAFFGSFIFYTWGAPVFSLVLLLSGFADHIIARRLAQTPSKFWLGIGVTINLGTLFTFKYFNFFVDNARVVVEELGMHFPRLAEIALPLGISFFTFQKISYLVDVYRKESDVADSLLDYLLFVFLFPQLIAGPIVRYKDIAGQIRDRSDNQDYALKLAGFQRFVIGLVKKVLIADVLAPVADAAFRAAPDLEWFSAILGILAFSFQIYYDFSGYSDMAIGLGMMIGFRFPENFNWPYVAHGFRDFWLKWHITLSTWLRNYLYYPLGGGRVASWKVIRNLWVVFLLSGLWHGASWTFVIWGAWHGFFISLDRFTTLFKRINPVSSALLTFSLVTLGWVWFRAPNLEVAFQYFQRLFLGGGTDAIEVSSRAWFFLAIAVVFAFVPSSLHSKLRSLHGENRQNLLLKSGVALLFLLLCLAQIGITEGQPFIYFRF